MAVADGTGPLATPGPKEFYAARLDQGNDGICLLANYSEQFLLDDSERDALTRLCLEHVAGRVPVIAGTGSNATSEAVRLTKHAREVGADSSLQAASPTIKMISTPNHNQSFTITLTEKRSGPRLTGFGG